MTGAAEGPPTSFAKLHFFIFLWVPSASQGVQKSEFSALGHPYPISSPAPIPFPSRHGFFQG